MPRRTAIGIVEIAHELREQLCTILLWEQILRATDDRELRRQGLESIRACVEAQRRAIERVVRMERARQRRSTPRPAHRKAMRRGHGA
jgi:hypothetical protein